MKNLMLYFENPLTVLYILLIFNLVVAAIVILASNFIRKAMKNIIKVTEVQFDASKQMEKSFTTMMEAMVKMTELRKQIILSTDDEKTKKISQ